ncbi:hypothetical protein ABPG73_018942 [Tetrahymena malaccensis]
MIMTSYVDYMKSQIQLIAAQYSNKFNFLKKFQSDQQVKKKVNPILKEKVQRALQNYLSMNQAQRKYLFISAFEKQLTFKSKTLLPKPQSPNTLQNSIVQSIKSQIIEQEKNSFFLERDTNLDLALNNIKTNIYQNLQGNQGFQLQI